MKEVTNNKLYTPHYVLLFDNKGLVIWACGTEDWKQFFKPHPKLRYNIASFSYDCSKRYAK